MTSIPLLILSDAPDQHTGLARITRDLASLASRLPEFRIATLGLGGRGSRQLPFAQYHIQRNMGTGEGQWGEWSLPEVWADFAGRQRGIVFTIWDASRLLWFAQPGYLGDQDSALRDFLRAGHFVRWGYFPIDSTGPGDKLTSLTRDTLLGYDRILTYTQWARGVVERTIGAEASAQRDLDWMPHGINTATFCIRDRQEARARWDSRLHEDDVLLGVVATNQERKDWGLVATTARILKDRLGVRFKLWCHTDVLIRAWSLQALLNDYGLTDCAFLSTSNGTTPDIELAWKYSACDVTMHPGPEGFGYPIAESLACGVPAVHMNYAGGAEIIQAKSMLVEPMDYRLSTQFDVMRPTFKVSDWADAILRAIGADTAKCRESVEFLSWSNLWAGAWQKWLLRGLTR